MIEATGAPSMRREEDSGAACDFETKPDNYALPMRLKGTLPGSDE